MTPSGRAVTVAGVVLVAVGILVGYPQVVGPAIAVLAVALLTVALTPAPPRDLTAQWVDPRQVAGRPARLRVQWRLTSPQWFPTRVTVLAGPQATPLAHFVLRAGGRGRTHTEYFSTGPLPRGIHTLSGLRSETSDDLGLTRREHRHPGGSSLIVQPRTVPLGRTNRAEGEDDSSGIRGPGHLPGSAFHSLRPYQPGDDVRHIHWMATARTRTVMVREFVPPRTTRLTLVVDTDGTAYAGARPDAFEAAVSIAASMALATLADEEVWIHTGAGLLARHRARTATDDVLDPLAALRIEPPDPALLRRALRPASDLTVVTGASVDVGRWRAIAGARPLTLIRVGTESDRSPRAFGPFRMIDVRGLEDLAGPRRST